MAAEQPNPASWHGTALAMLRNGGVAIDTPYGSQEPALRSVVQLDGDMLVIVNGAWLAASNPAERAALAAQHINQVRETIEAVLAGLLAWPARLRAGMLVAGLLAEAATIWTARDLAGWAAAQAAPLVPLLLHQAVPWLIRIGGAGTARALRTLQQEAGMAWLRKTRPDLLPPTAKWWQIGPLRPTYRA